MQIETTQTSNRDISLGTLDIFHVRRRDVLVWDGKWWQLWWLGVVTKWIWTAWWSCMPWWIGSSCWICISLRSCTDSYGVLVLQSGHGGTSSFSGDIAAWLGNLVCYHNSQRFQLIPREELQITTALRVVVYTRHLVWKNEMILPLIWLLTGFGAALRWSTSWYWLLTITLLIASFPRRWHDDRQNCTELRQDVEILAKEIL